MLSTMDNRPTHLKKFTTVTKLIHASRVGGGVDGKQTYAGVHTQTLIF